MEFKDRKGKNLNRKKLKIISQTPTELVVDMERFDEVEEEGTKIDASVFNTFQSEISISNNNSSNAISIANSAKMNHHRLKKSLQPLYPLPIQLIQNLRKHLKIPM